MNEVYSNRGMPLRITPQFPLRLKKHLRSRVNFYRNRKKDLRNVRK